MGTRGAITFVAGGVEKTVYNHFDSYPTGLGVTVLDWLRSPSWDLATVRAQVEALRLVDDSDEPTPEEREQFAHLADPGVSTGRDWYSLLRETQGEPAAILEAGVAGDATGFPLDSLFCEWAYVIDLDQETFEVYEGFQRSGPVAGRWADRKSDGDYWPVNRVQICDIAEIRHSDVSSRSIMEAIESAESEVDA